MNATKEIAKRFGSNPILRTGDVRPSREDFVVECVLNPGAFTYRGRVGLLLRVAERPAKEEGWVSTLVLDPEAEGGTRILRVRVDDPEFSQTDPRLFNYRGQTYLTTLSHLRLAWSEDGQSFTVEDRPTVIGRGSYETFGVEDCRVTQLENRFVLTYTAVSPLGVAVGMTSTSDWLTFEPPTIIIPPHNKDCAILPRKVAGQYWALHRPSGVGIGGNNMWISRSPDLRHWGDHQCLAASRPGLWDSERIGAGAAPVETSAGWLEIYHGADASSRYCLGAMLLDLNSPDRVLARSARPILEPAAPYELTGFFGQVVFSNGQVVRGDQMTIYYGAADSVICGATLSVSDVLASLAG